MTKLLIFLVTFLILALLISQVNLHHVLHYFATADYEMVVVVLFLLAPQWALNAIRVQWIAKKQCPLGFVETLKLNFAGGLFNVVTPMRLGDMSRAFFLKQLGKSTFSQGINFFAFDKVLNFFTLVLISLLSFLWIRLEVLGLKLLLVGLVSFVGLAIFLFFSSSKLGMGFHRFSWIFLLSCASWFLHLLQLYCFFVAFHANLSLLRVMALSPIAILIGLLPITLGGMGTRDAAMIFLFKPLDPALVLGVSLLFTARLWLEALIGVPFVQGYFKTRGVSCVSVGN